MTGFDPTAPLRDTEQDEPEQFPDNVVPPEELTEHPAAQHSTAQGAESGSARSGHDTDDDDA